MLNLVTVIFVDYNGDGVINDADKTNIGKGDPDWTFGLNFGASWKLLDFSMLWAGSFSNKIFDATRRVEALRYVNLPEEFMDRWHGGHIQYNASFRMVNSQRQ